MSKTSRTYYAAAVFVSAAWYGLLLLIPPFSELLRGSLEVGHLTQIVLFIFSGVLVARLFRRRIVSAEGQAKFLLGAALPFIGGMIFILSLLVHNAVSGNLGGGDVGAALIYGPIFMATGFWFIIPAGILSELIMQRAGLERGKNL